MKKITSMTRDRQLPKVHGRLWKAVQEKLDEKRKKQKLLAGAQLGHLPGDLIYKIFLLLPADSVHISSLVCKGWFKLIKSSYFTETYNRQSDKVLIYLKTVQGRRPRTFCFEPYSLFPFSREPQSKTTYINFVEIEEAKGKVIESSVGGLHKILATCNGLILGTYERKPGLVVVNPATRKHISIPLGTTLRSYGESYALVFNPKTRDYKVIHLFNEETVYTCCEIFSLSNKSWHAVDGHSPGLRRFKGKPVEAFHSLHWLPHGFSGHILSMKVEDEIFFTIDLPTAREVDDCLVEIKGCLAFVSREVRYTMDIWVLSGLEGEEWEKKHTIVTDVFPREMYVPVCTMCWGRELVFYGLRGSSFYTYDLETTEARKVEMENGTNEQGYLHQFPLWAHSNTLASWDSEDVLQ